MVQGPSRFPWVRNFIGLLALECCWAFGWWLASPLTVIPNFLMRFNAPPHIIGMIPALWGIGIALGAVAAPWLGARFRRLGTFLGWAHLTAIAPYFGMTALAFAAQHTHISDEVGQVVAIISMAAFSLLIGPLFQLYFVLVSRILPEDRRGPLIGIVFAVSTLIGLAGPAVATGILGGPDAGMGDYARIFLVSGLCMALGCSLFFILREKLPRVTTAQSGGVFTGLLKTWRSSPRLRGYIWARLWLDGGILAPAFLATYSRIEAGLTEATVTALGVVVVASQAASSLLLGWLSGHKRAGGRPDPQGFLSAQWIARSLLTVSLLFAVFGPAGPAAICLAIGAGLLSASDLVVHPNILLEMGPRRDRTQLMTLGTVVFSPTILLLPPLCGKVIERFGHRPVFALAVVFGLVGLVRLKQLISSRPGR